MEFRGLSRAIGFIPRYGRNISIMGRRAEQQHQPTYGEVFPTQGNAHDNPITQEGMVRMKSAETQVVGQVIKGGTAALYKSGTGNENETAPADVACDEVNEAQWDIPSLDEIVDPIDVTAGMAVDSPRIIEVTAAMSSNINEAFAVDATKINVEHPITIGEALEVAGQHIGDKPIETKDARTIQSAESRATGNAPGVKKVMTMEAQSAAANNGVTATVEEVLSHASEKLPIDKVVTTKDAARVQAAEMRNSSDGRIDPGGIAATIQSAADRNVATGYAPSTVGGARIENS